MKDGMHRKATTAGGGVDHGFMLLGVEHLDAHIDHVAGGEVLPFLALAAFVDQIFEGLIHHVQVGVEQLHPFQ